MNRNEARLHHGSMVERQAPEVADQEEQLPASERRPMAAPSGAPQAVREEERALLFGEHESAALRARWNEIQASFIDEPRRAVELADNLVGDLLDKLAQTFHAQKQELRRTIDAGDKSQRDEGSTEALRVALRRYRSLFTRLLAA